MTDITEITTPRPGDIREAILEIQSELKEIREEVQSLSHPESAGWSTYIWALEKELDSLHTCHWQDNCEVCRYRHESAGLAY